MAARLTLASIATSNPMGAEAYQEKIRAQAPRALAHAGGEWTVRSLRVRSLRSPLDGNRRLPLSRVAAASSGVRRLLARGLYAGDAVSHRMNLELPPHPTRDVVTIHDTVAWRFSDESPPVPAAAEEARRAAAVICVSEFSAEEVARLLHVREPVVIPNGVDARFYDAAPLSEDRRRIHGIPARYLLHAGGASRRKNLEVLAEAWPRIRAERPDLTLVLAGPEHARRTALFAGVEGVRMTGRLPAEDMPGLVAGAEAVVIPSLYEGFGLPALEAMAAHVPVVAADTTALREVVDDAGFLVPPTAEGILAGTLEVTQEHADLASLVSRARLRAAAFTWERCAERHAAVWANVR